MSSGMSEKELLDQLAHLPREIRPARDPWPGILSRIEGLSTGRASSGSRPNWWLRAAAASVLLAFAAGLLLKPLLNEKPRLPDALASNFSEQASGIRPALLNTADAEYVAAFREFITIGKAGADLSPQTIEKIEGGWADLRVTEEALAAALEQNPGDLFLNERMLELRARQIGFLKQLAALDRNNRRMTI